MLKSLLVRLALWHLNRKLDKLEARFIDVRADLYRHEVGHA